MEETVANVRLEVDELQHRDIFPNQSVWQEIKNVPVTAEETTENPEYVVMRRSIAVQTVKNEEVIIPKQDSACNQRSNLNAVCFEGGNSMEIDISSQESVMDIASQESLSAKGSNSEEPKYCDVGVSASLVEELLIRVNPILEDEPKYCDLRVSATSGEELLIREPKYCDLQVSASSGEELLMREEALRKREEALLECQERVRILEEVVANRKRALLQMEMDIPKYQEMLNNREAELYNQELILKKLETAIKIRELESLGYKVIPLNGESNGCLPAKRAKKN